MSDNVLADGMEQMRFAQPDSAVENSGLYDLPGACATACAAAYASCYYFHDERLKSVLGVEN